MVAGWRRYVRWRLLGVCWVWKPRPYVKRAAVVYASNLYAGRTSAGDNQKRVGLIISITLTAFDKGVGELNDHLGEITKRAHAHVYQPVRKCKDHLFSC